MFILQIEKIMPIIYVKNPTNASEFSFIKQHIFKLVKKIYALYVVLFATQIILGFICAPHSCEWGNTIYFYFGIFSLTVSFILPFFKKNWRLDKRIGYGFLFLVISVFLWCTFFMLCGFSIICRLF